MDKRKFRSGSFSDTDQIKQKEKEKPKEEPISRFKGIQVTNNMSISSISKYNYEVLKSGHLCVSGALRGDIKINGGTVDISGLFKGQIIFISGKLNISGMAKGTMEYHNGEITSSGINRLEMI